MFRFLHLVLALFFGSLSFAQTMPREEWLKAFSAELPRQTCEDGQALRRIYKISREDCFKTMNQAIDNCVKKQGDKIPAQIDLEEDAIKIAESIGECAGDSFADSATVDPKGLVHYLSGGMISRKTVIAGVVAAFAFLLFIGIVVFWAVHQSRKR